MKRFAIILMLCIVLLIGCTIKNDADDTEADNTDPIVNTTTTLHSTATKPSVSFGFPDDGLPRPYYKIYKEGDYQTVKSYYVGMDYKDSPLTAPYFKDGIYTFVSHSANLRVFNTACDKLSKANTYEMTFVKCETMKEAYENLPSIANSDASIMYTDDYSTFGFNGFLNGKWGYGISAIEDDEAFTALIDTIDVLAVIPNYVQWDTPMNSSWFSYSYEYEEDILTVSIYLLKDNFNYGYVSAGKKLESPFIIETTKTFIAFIDTSEFKIGLEELLNRHAEVLNIPE